MNLGKKLHLILKAMAQWLDFRKKLHLILKAMAQWLDFRKKLHLILNYSEQDARTTSALLPKLVNKQLKNLNLISQVIIWEPNPQD